jgi:hypothetical protein
MTAFCLFNALLRFIVLRGEGSGRQTAPAADTPAATARDRFPA